MRRLSMFALAALTLALIFAPSRASNVQADSFGAIQRLLDGESATAQVTAVSTHSPIIVRYVGPSSAGGTVTVAAGGDITFSVGAVGASAVDDSLECPVSGALGGIFDLSTPAAACDTLGEIVDLINKSPNWRAVLRDGMRGDPTDNVFATLSETAANTPNGLALLGDSGVTFDVAAEITPERTIARSLDGPYAYIQQNPSVSSRVALFKIAATSTYGSGTSTIEVFSCKTLYPSSWGAVTAGSVSGYAAKNNGSETCTTLDSVAGAATTVEKVLTYDYALESKKGERLIVRLNNSAAMTAATLYAYGRVTQLQ